MPFQKDSSIGRIGIELKAEYMEHCLRSLPDTLPTQTTKTFKIPSRSLLAALSERESTPPESMDSSDRIWWPPLQRLNELLGRQPRLNLFPEPIKNRRTSEPSMRPCLEALRPIQQHSPELPATSSDRPLIFSPERSLIGYIRTPAGLAWSFFPARPVLMTLGISSWPVMVRYDGYGCRISTRRPTWNPRRPSFSTLFPLPPPTSLTGSCPTPEAGTTRTSPTIVNATRPATIPCWNSFNEMIHHEPFPTC